jgi:hypothetical protein
VTSDDKPMTLCAQWKVDTSLCQWETNSQKMGTGYEMHKSQTSALAGWMSVVEMWRPELNWRMKDVVETSA